MPAGGNNPANIIGYTAKIVTTTLSLTIINLTGINAMSIRQVETKYSYK